MENKPEIRPTPQLAVGLIIIFLGILFTLDNLNLLNVFAYLRFWPALLLAYGAYRLLEPGDPPHYVAGIIFTVIGGVLLLNTLHLRLPLLGLWPIALMMLGFAILSHALRRREGVGDDASATISAFAFLGGVQRTCRSKNFRGGDLTAIMGSCEIDLRQAEMPADRIVISTLSMWGGIELRVPDHWTVTMEVMPIMGGCDDHTQTHGDGPPRHLIIKGIALMGGVEVRN